MNKKNKQSGQTLLEALIALATAVVIISAMAAVVLSSLNNAQFSKNQNQATQYAQQGIEFLKNQGQYNWALITAYPVNNCMPADNSLSPRVGQSCSPNPNVGIFLREVIIYQSSDSINNTCNPSANSALITVSVGWSDNKCTSLTDPYCHKVKISSCVYNSPTIPAP